MGQTRRYLGLSAAIFAWFAASGPAFAADLAYADAAPTPASGWQFSFTPYGWMININGDFSTGGNTVAVNESFFDIVDKADSLAAFMGYFEARKGKLGVFADVIWLDLGFSSRINTKGSPFARFPRVVVSAVGKAEVDYQSTIIGSGLAYEVAHWQNASGSHTALDLLGGARYWNEEVSLSVNLTGTLAVDLKRLGFNFNRSRSIAVAKGRTLEWVDPFVGARVRHQIAPGKELRVRGSIGGFGVGSEFSWQAGANYGFQTRCLGMPLNLAIGYRALYVDYSESGPFGKNGLDALQHGPMMGITFNW